MKVKLGDGIIYDSRLQPILIIFQDQDEKNKINEMDTYAFKYLVCPDTFTKEDLDEFLKNT